MILEEQFDPDEILRDVDEADYANTGADEIRELKFGTMHDEHRIFNDMETDLNSTEDSTYSK
jgi:hypothetical protein